MCIRDRALASQVEEVNHHILGLSESNNKIMENISQLSAVTEEVTANAEQVHTLSLIHISAGTKYLNTGFIHGWTFKPLPAFASSRNLSQPPPTL